MKFILLVVAVLALLWLLRRTVRSALPPRAARPPQAPRPLPMLACAQCGLHLPVNEALPGRGGVFCGEAHRAAFEQAHPE